MTRSLGRILVVDDEAPMRDVLREYFIGQGYAVETASNGDEALAVIKLKLGAFDYVAKPFDFSYLDRAAAAGLVRPGGPATWGTPGDASGARQAPRPGAG